MKLYKSGVHKILGVPRRWTISKPSISLPVFKKALDKRAEALVLAAKDAVEDSSKECDDKAVSDAENSRKRKRGDDLEEQGGPTKQMCVDKEKSDGCAQASEDLRQDEGKLPEVSAQQPAEPPEAQLPETSACPQHPPEIEKNESKQTPEPANANAHDEPAKRKAELEEKLRTLTNEKHRLVQLLKQILTNEEESKRRGQGLVQSPPTTSNPNPKPVEAALLVAPQQSVVHSEAGVRPMDLEEGELDYARTPSPRPKSRQVHQVGATRLAYHSSSHSHGSGLTRLLAVVGAEIWTDCQVGRLTNHSLLRYYEQLDQVDKLREISAE